METDHIFKKEINGKTKWIYQCNSYNGFYDRVFSRETEFDTFYDAEHYARVHSDNEKYKGTFTRLYDKNGNVTYKKEDAVFEIVPPNSNQYFYVREFNADLTRVIKRYENSFWRKLFKFFFKITDEPLDYPKTTVKMIHNGNEVTIFKGEDWGKAENYIKQFVKTNPIYDMSDGDIQMAK